MVEVYMLTTLSFCSIFFFFFFFFFLPNGSLQKTFLEIKKIPPPMLAIEPQPLAYEDRTQPQDYLGK